MILFVVYLYSSSSPLILQNSISTHSSLFALLSYHAFISNHRRKNIYPLFLSSYSHLLLSLMRESSLSDSGKLVREVFLWVWCVGMGMAMLQYCTMNSWWQEMRNSVIDSISQYAWHHVFHIVNAQQKLLNL